MTAIRCPYCTEGNGFKTMIAQGGADCYVCARCGHLVMPANPQFKCTCDKCAELEPFDRKARRKPV